MTLLGSSMLTWACLQAAQDLLTQSWAAAEQLCGPAPLLVRLAVEAEVRLRDWQALAASQRRAAGAGSAAGSLSWGSYQSKVQAELELLQGALPGALQEAQAASASAAAAVAAAAQQVEEAAQEDGEVPAEMVCSCATLVSCGLMAVVNRAGLWLVLAVQQRSCACGHSLFTSELAEGADHCCDPMQNGLLTYMHHALFRIHRDTLHCLRSHRQPLQMILPWIWTPQMTDPLLRHLHQLACQPQQTRLQLPPLLQCQSRSPRPLSQRQHPYFRPSQQLQIP